MPILPKSAIALINNEYMLRQLSQSGVRFSLYSGRKTGSRIDLEVIIIFQSIDRIQDYDTGFAKINEIIFSPEYSVKITKGDFFIASDMIVESEFKKTLSSLKLSEETANAKTTTASLNPLKALSVSTTGDKKINSKTTDSQIQSSNSSTIKKTNRKLIWVPASITLLIVLFLVFYAVNKKTTPAPATTNKVPGTKAIVQPSSVPKQSSEMPKKEGFFEEGKKCYDAGEFDKAFNFYLQSAKSTEKNGPDGIIATAFCYESGKGVEMNMDKAIDWYFQAAQKGRPEAVDYLKKLSDKKGMDKNILFDKIAQCYDNAYGVKADQDETLNWHIKSFESGDKDTLVKITSMASEKNSGKAQIYLAEYFSKEGNNEETEKYYSLAFKNGHSELGEKLKDVLLGVASEKYESGDKAGGAARLKKAESLLGISLMELKDNKLLLHYGESLLEGKGTDKNIFEAEKFLEKAYHAGNPDVKIPLATAYLQIADVKKAENKENESLDYLRKSVRFGNSEANALLQSSEYDVAKKEMNSNPEKALPALVSIAEDKNHKYSSAAQKILGEYYFKSKQWEDAGRWFLISSENGDKGIRINLALCQYEIAKKLQTGGRGKESFEYLGKAYDNGNSDAGYDLAGYYSKGAGCEKDLQKAIRIYETLSANGMEKPKELSSLYLELAKEYYNSKKYPSALEYFKKVTEEKSFKGEPDNFIGSMYSNGHGVITDYYEAEKYYKSAVGNGCKEAQSSLDTCRYNICLDLFEKKQYQKAIDYFMTIPESKETDDILMKIGESFQKMKDWQRAEESYRKMKNSSESQKRIIKCCREAEKFYNSSVENKQKGIEYLEKAAGENDNDSIESLGNYYYTACSYQDAKKWFQKGASNGSLACMFWLAKTLLQIKDGPLDSFTFLRKNSEIAYIWYLTAARKDYIPAMNGLANCYYNGIGTDKNKDKAIEWYNKASAKGDLESTYNLGMIYWNDNNKEEAVKYWKQAAKKGHKGAINFLQKVKTTEKQEEVEVEEVIVEEVK